MRQWADGAKTRNERVAPCLSPRALVKRAFAGRETGMSYPFESGRFKLARAVFAFAVTLGVIIGTFLVIRYLAAL